MKKIAFLFASIGLFIACNNNTEETVEETPEVVVEEAVVEYEIFGDSTLTDEGAIAATELLAFMGDQTEVDVKVKGTINEVCQKKGCWMSVALDDETNMHVSYDYEFLLPLNCGGKEMVMSGTAFYDTISVKHLRHLAEDANKSEEEINAITEPKPTLAFLATGVMIKK